MVLKVRKSAEEIETKITGSEPNFSGKIMCKLNMVSSLNWYNQNRDSKFAIKSIQDYLRKNKIKVDSDIVNKQISTFGFLCRLKNNGAIFSESDDIGFNNYLRKMRDAIPEIIIEEKTVVTNVISIQDRINEKTSEIIGELEGHFDDFILNGFTKPASAYGIMHGRIKGVHANKVMEFYKKKRQEYSYLIDTDDKDLKEGYSNFNKTQLKKLVTFCDSVITDCIKLNDESKVTRKPKKRKKKTPDQLVNKLIFCAESDPHKIKSINPAEIIGASQLWIFNTKNRKLGVYNTLDAEGLSVKGTTIINFDEVKSVMKTLRKPETILPEIIKGGKVYMRNVMTTINSVEMQMNGRINKDIVILRVIK
jgi:hypothetical protein